MKQSLIVVFSLISFCSFSQTIKQGSKLNYTISTDDGSIDLLIKIDSLSPSFVRFKWSSQNVGTGSWDLQSKSLETANTGRWSQLEPDKIITLPNDQSVVVISKAQWASIQKDKKTELDMVKYAVKKNPQPFKISGKEADVIYLENEDGTSKLWILNNPSFPAMVKISGNKFGADAELKTVD